MNTRIPTNDHSLHVRKGKILIVDDDEATRFLHSNLLSRAGYDTEEAADGEEAWMMIFTTSYDLVLTDYNMPRLNGLDLVARMRASAMTVPVIVVSGALELGETSDYPGLQLNAIVQKSFEFRDVLDAVMRVLPAPQNETAYSPKVALFRGRPAPAHLVLTQLN